jgi:hypothetical protein
MRLAAFFSVVFLALGLGSLPSSVSAGPVTFVTLKNAPDGSASIQSGMDYTTTSLGYAFKTGSSGPFDIDWVTMNLTSGAAAASATFKISIHGTNNQTAYLAIPNSTVYASDTVTVTTPGTTNTPFDVTFTSAEIPSIANLSLLSNTSYSLFVNSQSGAGIALRRKQGVPVNTTNDEYTVTNGFVMLDTFRNNTPNYTNSPGSYPAFAMSFGGTASAPSAVPEPATLAISTLVVGGTLVRRYRRGRRSI